MKIAIFVVCVALVSCASALSCRPCETVKCKNVKCRGPKTLGVCGCCPVCAKLEGETCGGDWNLAGTCAKGLLCLKKREVVVTKDGSVEVPNWKIPPYSQIGICTRKYSSCSEACESGKIKPTQHFLSYWGKSTFLAPEFEEDGFWGYCDCSPGAKNAWTLVQRRASGIWSFDNTWKEYAKGFGVSGNDYWLGLERMHRFTKYGNHELMIAIQFEDGQISYSTYRKFRVGSDSTSYKLTLGKGEGDGSSEFVKTHRGMKFSTKNVDNDNWKIGGCAEALRGGWWYSRCTMHNLNGVYYGIKPLFLSNVLEENALEKPVTVPKLYAGPPPETLPYRITWSGCSDRRIRTVEIKMRPTQ